MGLIVFCIFLYIYIFFLLIAITALKSKTFMLCFSTKKIILTDPLTYFLALYWASFFFISIFLLEGGGSSGLDYFRLIVIPGPSPLFQQRRKQG